MDLGKIFLQATSTNQDLADALAVAQGASPDGHIWLMGGSVFRPLCSSLYSTTQNQNYDFDFLLEQPANEGYLSKLPGWKLTHTGLGEPSLINGNKQIDLIWLDHAINPHEKTNVQTMTTQEKIESYLRRVPLNVQSILFDVNNQIVIGEVGTKSILDKKVAVNNFDECLSFCKRRRISVRKFMASKAGDLSFQVQYPDFHETAKSDTVTFYDQYAAEYTSERGSAQNTFITDYLGQEVSNFLKKLKGNKLLDIGSGPGRDARYFQSKGINVTCIDTSMAMVEACQKQGLQAYQMDVENMTFDEESHDAVWSYAALVHIPKQRIYNALARISEVLRHEGLFFVGMIEGDAERLHESKTKPGRRRFFALYQDQEFREILSDYFEIITSKRIAASNGETYLNYLCRKRSENGYKRQV